MGPFPEERRHGPRGSALVIVIAVILVLLLLVAAVGFLLFFRASSVPTIMAVPVTAVSTPSTGASASPTVVTVQEGVSAERTLSPAENISARLVEAFSRWEDLDAVGFARQVLETATLVLESSQVAAADPTGTRSGGRRNLLAPSGDVWGWWEDLPDGNGLKLVFLRLAPPVTLSVKENDKAVFATAFLLTLFALPEDEGQPTRFELAFGPAAVDPAKAEAVLSVSPFLRGSFRFDSERLHHSMPEGEKGSVTLSEEELAGLRAAANGVFAAVPE